MRLVKHRLVDRLVKHRLLGSPPGPTVAASHHPSTYFQGPTSVAIITILAHTRTIS